MNVMFSKHKMSELIQQLDFNNKDQAERAKHKIVELFNTVKESWLIGGLFNHYLRTNSVKTMEILINVPDCHHSYLFDKLSDSLKNERDSKMQALTLLGHVIRNQPTWLHNIKDHQVILDVLTIAKDERDNLLLISALLIIVTIMPIIPMHIGPFLDRILEIFSQLLRYQCVPQQLGDEQFLHLQMAVYALFLRLYGMFPHKFIEYLHHERFHESELLFSHTIKPLFYSVRLNPLFIVCDANTEMTPDRWRCKTIYDIITECENLTSDPDERFIQELCIPLTSTPEINLSTEVKPNIGCTQSSDEKDFFSGSSFLKCDPSVEFGSSSNNSHTNQESSTACSDSQPDPEVIDGHSCHSQGSSPPETAVEATPDATLGKPGNLGNHSSQEIVQPSSPLKIVPNKMSDTDRNSMCNIFEDSAEAVKISKEMVSNSLHDIENSDHNESTYEDPEHGSPCSAGGLHMPNLTDCARKVQRLRFLSQCNPETEKKSTESSPGSYILFPDLATVRRARSCPEMKKTLLPSKKNSISKPLKETDEESSENACSGNQSQKITTECGTQTENFWPMPYEHLFLGLFPKLEKQECTKDSPVQTLEEKERPSIYDFLGKCVEATARSEEDIAIKDTHLILYQQLLYEKHRREIHAYSNRRLFPKLRNTRYLEEINSALRDQIQLQQRDIDSLRNQINDVKCAKLTSDSRYPQLVEYLENQHNLLEAKIQDLSEQITKLEAHIKEVETKCEEKTSLHKQIEESFRDVLADVKVTREQAEAAVKSKAQVVKLKRDLLMAGELIVKYEQKSKQESSKPNYENELKHVKHIHNNQTKNLGQQTEQKVLLLDATLARVTDLEQKILSSEENINTMKIYLKEADDSHGQQLKVLSDKYTTQLRINQALEEKLFEMVASIDRPDIRSPDLSSCQEVDLSSISASVISSDQAFTKHFEATELFNLQDIIDQSLSSERGRVQAGLTEEEKSLPGPSATLQSISQEEACSFSEPLESSVETQKHHLNLTSRTESHQ